MNTLVNSLGRRGVQLLNCLLWRMLLHIGRYDAVPGMADRNVTLIFLSSAGKVVATAVSVAANFEARRRGLLDREQLHPEEGLLLAPGGSIHTVGMRFGIDALFLDQHMEVLKCVHALRPWRAALAPLGTQYVLELAAGRLVETGVARGTRLFWLECRAAGVRE